MRAPRWTLPLAGVVAAAIGTSLWLAVRVNDFETVAGRIY